MEKSRVGACVDWSLLAICAGVLMAVPSVISGDGLVRFEALESLLGHGKLTGTKYSLVGPLFATPLYVLGHAIGATKPVTGLFNRLLLLVLAIAVWRGFQDELPRSVRRTLLVLLVLASMFAHHAQGFYGEVFTTVATTVGIVWLARGLAVRGWTAILLGAVNTPATLLGVAGIGLSHARLTRRWLPLWAPVVAFALVCLEALVSRGSLSATGYADDHGFQTALPYSGLPNFSYPFLFGLLSIVLSFGKGLVFFAPGLFLPLQASTPPRVRWVQQTLVLYVVGLVVAYAKWWAWYGGWFWGPRFFLAASVPASLALAIDLSNARVLSDRRRLVVAVALFLSFWVGVNGLAFQNTGLSVCQKNDFEYEAFCHYVPELSVLWHPFVDSGATLPLVRRVLAWVATGVWCFAAGWVGRDVLGLLLGDAYRSLLRWRQWW